MKPADQQEIKKVFEEKQPGKKNTLSMPSTSSKKTQTEAFLEFQAIHPDVKIKQRKFESLNVAKCNLG